MYIIDVGVGCMSKSRSYESGERRERIHVEPRITVFWTLGISWNCVSLSLSLFLQMYVYIYIYANPLASRHDPVCNQVWIEDYGNGELWNVMEMENHGDGES